MLVRAIPAVLGFLLVSGCTPGAGEPGLVARQPTGPTGEGGESFWQRVEDARTRGGGDPDAMAEILRAEFARSGDQALRAFQRDIVEASRRLYTWRHGDAAEMICGFVSDDVFTDWRSWVITLGRETYTRIAEDPDALADVADLSPGCAGGGELFGAAVSGIWFERHGDADGDFPWLEPSYPPRGKRLTDRAAVRRGLPRLSARIGADGLGQPPGFFD